MVTVVGGEPRSCVFLEGSMVNLRSGRCSGVSNQAGKEHPLSGAAPPFYPLPTFYQHVGYMYVVQIVAMLPSSRGTQLGCWPWGAEGSRDEVGGGFGAGGLGFRYGVFWALRQLRIGAGQLL